MNHEGSQAQTRPQDPAVFDPFRRSGYLKATLDPLGRLPSYPVPELEAPAPEAEEARRIYCGSIGAEFMHLLSPERRRFIQERMEGVPPPSDGPRILDRLLRADLFEQVLQVRYIGTKRYSLEGLTALIPLLDEILRRAGAVRAVESDPPG